LIWRVICFASGACLGLLAGLAVVGAGSPRPAWLPTLSDLVLVELAVAAGGLLLLGVASWIARVRDDDPDRGLHLAASACVGFAALPAAAGALFDLAPGPGAWLGALAAVLALALVRGARRHGPTRGLAGCLVAAGAAIVVGGALFVASAAVRAALGPEAPAPTESQRAAVFDLDARVATRALPRCGPGVAEARVLAVAGAHPRLGADGRFLWFDAAAPDGRRQVYRLDRERESAVCWSCDEPGNNRRPSPSLDGTGVVFDTDRFATWRDRANTELQLASAGGDGPGLGSRRLTVSPGPDEQALFGPSPSLLVWSRGEGGRFAVVSAVVRSGHGGLVLGRPAPLVEGRGALAVPLAWSPDARSLVVALGTPLRPARAESIDLATAARSPVGDGVVVGAPASHDADGGWLALATAERARPAGLLPARLGFLVDAFVRSRPDAPRFRGTGVRVGEPFDAGAELALGEVAAWGEPTGVAVAPDGGTLVLGQRRASADAIEERLVELRLTCGGA